MLNCREHFCEQCNTSNIASSTTVSPNSPLTNSTQEDVLANLHVSAHLQTKSCVITLTVFLAYFSRAAPWLLKMATLALSRSFLSMPSFLGMEPTKMAASRSLKATSSLSVGTISVERYALNHYWCQLNMLIYSMNSFCRHSSTASSVTTQSLQKRYFSMTFDAQDLKALAASQLFVVHSLKHLHRSSQNAALKYSACNFCHLRSLYQKNEKNYT